MTAGQSASSEQLSPKAPPIADDIQSLLGWLEKCGLDEAIRRTSSRPLKAILQRPHPKLVVDVLSWLRAPGVPGRTGAEFVTWDPVEKRAYMSAIFDIVNALVSGAAEDGRANDQSTVHCSPDDILSGQASEQACRCD